MTKLSDTDAKVTALGTSLGKLSDDIQQLIADEGLSGPLVDSINTRLDAITAAVATADSNVQAADPGTGTSSSN